MSRVPYVSGPINGTAIGNGRLVIGGPAVANAAIARGGPATRAASVRTPAAT